MIPILLYHSVAAEPPPGMARWTVSPQRFAQDVAMMAESGRTALTVSEFALKLAAGKLSEQALVVTLDDGFADNVEAVHQLVDGGFTPTVFVTTSWIGHEGMLTVRDLHKIINLGAEIGAHSHTHRRLDELSTMHLEDEIAGSAASLSALTGIPCRSFAYPHGNFSAAVRNAVINAGYESACAVKNAMSGPADDRYGISRMTVQRSVSKEHFQEWLQGRGRTAPRHDLLRTRAFRVARRSRAGLMTGVHR
ncbi:polysaccharide deacetylase family protein [Frankia sp. Cr2]|uniref:polysaccharide deacetylase family protein n=1 Tax=Frankia sp. Cr2 TaxID=3073932 RepID=UPI002AD2D009|nr:polysaccharide deacetylase family protein [Frankia sp. Cr2]